MGSIVIPAWNEAAVIRRTLDQLFDGLGPDVDVIVACNGCTDATAEIARTSGHPLEVIDLPEPGKPAALRAAERATAAMPRLYVDADVELPGVTARQVLTELAAGAIAARPPSKLDVTGATWPVRSFAKVRAALPSVGAELYGAGVFGLSRTARERFDEFPDLVADDLYAARIVSGDEVRIVDSAPVVVRLPRDVGSLVATLARVQRGNRELRRHVPEIQGSTGTTTRELVRACRDVHLLPHVLVYCAIVVAGRVRSRRPAPRWERDDSTRSPETTT